MKKLLLTLFIAGAASVAMAQTTDTARTQTTTPTNRVKKGTDSLQKTGSWQAGRTDSAKLGTLGSGSDTAINRSTVIGADTTGRSGVAATDSTGNESMNSTSTNAASGMTEDAGNTPLEERKAKASATDSTSAADKPSKVKTKVKTADGKEIKIKTKDGQTKVKENR